MRFGSALLALTLFTGCLSDTGDDVPLADVEQFSFPLTSNAWPLNAAETAVIPVCWITSGYATEKAWVRTAVEQRLEQGSTYKVDFQGWQACPATGGGVRITIAEVNPPFTGGLGTATAAVGSGMWLNFTFATFDHALCTASPAARQQCIESIAMHEFGHVLGLAHEQSRPDRTPGCNEPAQGTVGDIYVSHYDLFSMMNYCNANYNNGGYPGDSDVTGLSRMYGNGGEVFVAASYTAGAAWSQDPNGQFGHAYARTAKGCLQGESCFLGDATGDGKDDVIAFSRSTGAVFVSKSNGPGALFDDRLSWKSGFCSGNVMDCRVGDFNGDGRTDILKIDGNVVSVALANTAGTAFGTATSWHSSFGAHTNLYTVYAVGKVNAGTTDDLIAFDRSTAKVYVTTSTGTAFSGDSQWNGAFGYSVEQVTVGDVTGDGKADLVSFNQGDNDAFVAVSSGTSFGPRTLWSSSFSAPGQVPLVGDVDGDGKADAVSFERGNFGAVKVARSTGSAFGTVYQYTDGTCVKNDVCALGKVNGNVNANGIARVDAVSFKQLPGASQ